MKQIKYYLPILIFAVTLHAKSMAEPRVKGQLHVVQSSDVQILNFTFRTVEIVRHDVAPAASDTLRKKFSFFQLFARTKGCVWIYNYSKGPDARHASDVRIRRRHYPFHYAHSRSSLYEAAATIDQWRTWSCAHGNPP